MTAKSALQFGMATVALLLSGYLRYRGFQWAAWVAFLAGMALFAVVVRRVYRSRKDDTFKRFAMGTFVADPRSALFCTCGHELRVHTFRHDEMFCSRCESEGLRLACSTQKS